MTTPNLEWNDVPLPGPWKLKGACVGCDPELFFPKKGRKSPQALALCANCPVKAPCLRYALKWPVIGIWGGTYTSQRDKMTGRRLTRARRPDSARCQAFWADLSDYRHGSMNGYQYWGCRCERCRAAHAAGARRFGPGSRAPCGTDSGYKRHRADRQAACDACRRAHSEAVSQLAKRKRQPRFAAIPKTTGTAARKRYARRDEVRGRVGETQPTDLAR